MLSSSNANNNKDFLNENNDEPKDGIKIEKPNSKAHKEKGERSERKRAPGRPSNKSK